MNTSYCRALCCTARQRGSTSDDSFQGREFDKSSRSREPYERQPSNSVAQASTSRSGREDPLEPVVGSPSSVNASLLRSPQLFRWRKSKNDLKAASIRISTQYSAASDQLVATIERVTLFIVPIKGSLVLTFALKRGSQKIKSSNIVTVNQSQSQWVTPVGQQVFFDAVAKQFNRPDRTPGSGRNWTLTLKLKQAERQKLIATAAVDLTCGENNEAIESTILMSPASPRAVRLVQKTSGGSAVSSPEQHSRQTNVKQHFSTTLKSESNIRELSLFQQVESRTIIGREAETGKGMEKMTASQCNTKEIWTGGGPGPVPVKQEVHTSCPSLNGVGSFLLQNEQLLAPSDVRNQGSDGAKTKQQTPTRTPTKMRIRIRARMQTRNDVEEQRTETPCTNANVERSLYADALNASEFSQPHSHMCSTLASSDDAYAHVYACARAYAPSISHQASLHVSHATAKRASTTDTQNVNTQTASTHGKLHEVSGKSKEEVIESESSKRVRRPEDDNGNGNDSDGNTATLVSNDRSCAADETGSKELMLSDLGISVPPSIVATAERAQSLRAVRSLSRQQSVLSSAQDSASSTPSTSTPVAVNSMVFSSATPTASPNSDAKMTISETPVLRAQETSSKVLTSTLVSSTATMAESLPLESTGNAVSNAIDATISTLSSSPSSTPMDSPLLTMQHGASRNDVTVGSCSNAQQSCALSTEMKTNETSSEFPIGFGYAQFTKTLPAAFSTNTGESESEGESVAEVKAAKQGELDVNACQFPPLPNVELPPASSRDCERKAQQLESHRDVKQTAGFSSPSISTCEKHLETDTSSTAEKYELTADNDWWKAYLGKLSQFVDTSALQTDKERDKVDDSSKREAAEIKSGTLSESVQNVDLSKHGGPSVAPASAERDEIAMATAHGVRFSSSAAFQTNVIADSHADAAVDTRTHSPANSASAYASASAARSSARLENYANSDNTIDRAIAETQRTAALEQQANGSDSKQLRTQLRGVVPFSNAKMNAAEKSNTAGSSSGLAALSRIEVGSTVDGDLTKVLSPKSFRDQKIDLHKDAGNDADVDVSTSRSSTIGDSDGYSDIDTVQRNWFDHRDVSTTATGSLSLIRFMTSPPTVERPKLSNQSFDINCTTEDTTSAGPMSFLSVGDPRLRNRSDISPDSERTEGSERLSFYETSGLEKVYQIRDPILSSCSSSTGSCDEIMLPGSQFSPGNQVAIEVNQRFQLSYQNLSEVDERSDENRTEGNESDASTPTPTSTRTMSSQSLQVDEEAVSKQRTDRLAKAYQLRTAELSDSISCAVDETVAMVTTECIDSVQSECKATVSVVKDELIMASETKLSVSEVPVYYRRPTESLFTQSSGISERHSESDPFICGAQSVNDDDQQTTFRDYVTQSESVSESVIAQSNRSDERYQDFSVQDGQMRGTMSSVPLTQLSLSDDQGYYGNDVLVSQSDSGVNGHRIQHDGQQQEQSSITQVSQLELNSQHGAMRSDDKDAAPLTGDRSPALSGKGQEVSQLQSSQSDEVGCYGNDLATVSALGEHSVGLSGNEANQEQQSSNVQPELSALRHAIEVFARSQETRLTLVTADMSPREVYEGHRVTYCKGRESSVERVQKIKQFETDKTRRKSIDYPHTAHSCKRTTPDPRVVDIIDGHRSRSIGPSGSRNQDQSPSQSQSQFQHCLTLQQWRISSSVSEAFGGSRTRNSSQSRSLTQSITDRLPIDSYPIDDSRTDELSESYSSVALVPNIRVTSISMSPTPQDGKKRDFSAGNSDEEATEAEDEVKNMRGRPVQFAFSDVYDSVSVGLFKLPPSASADNSDSIREISRKLKEAAVLDRHLSSPPQGVDELQQESNSRLADIERRLLLFIRQSNNSLRARNTSHESELVDIERDLDSELVDLRNRCAQQFELNSRRFAGSSSLLLRPSSSLFSRIQAKTAETGLNSLVSRPVDSDVVQRQGRVPTSAAATSAISHQHSFLTASMRNLFNVERYYGYHGVNFAKPSASHVGQSLFLSLSLPKDTGAE